MAVKAHASNRSGVASWGLEALTWALLGGWFGSWGLFAFVIAPTAFQVLPTQAAAGVLIAPVLATLHNYGILAGASLALLGVLRQRGWLTIGLAAVLALLCVITEYAITPAIDEVQPRSFGASQEEEAARRFSDLHQMSRYIFGIVELGVLGLIVLHTRPSDRGQPGRAPQARA